MEEQIKNLEVKIDLLATDIKKMKRYFAATFWLTIIVFVLPLIVFLWMMPSFMSTFSNLGGMNLESLGIE